MTTQPQPMTVLAYYLARSPFEIESMQAWDWTYAQVKRWRAKHPDYALAVKDWEIVQSVLDEASELRVHFGDE
jgi:hypothetical protein